MTHKIYHNFIKWCKRNYGEDYNSKLIGYDVQEKIIKYSKNKDIKIVYCDDDVYASSILVLIPHPEHGITIIFIPQCTSINNTFFLYVKHYENLLKELNKMNSVYE